MKLSRILSGASQKIKYMESAKKVEGDTLETKMLDSNQSKSSHAKVDQFKMLESDMYDQSKDGAAENTL